jgi:hypothetical protein
MPPPPIQTAEDGGLTGVLMQKSRWAILKSTLYYDFFPDFQAFPGKYLRSARRQEGVMPDFHGF